MQTTSRSYWPDAYRVNRYVRGNGAHQTGADALGAFTRFPSWVWRNADVLDFVGWLRAHNDALPADAAKVGFYGLDLYSLHASITEVVGYLDKVDPEATSTSPTRPSRWNTWQAPRPRKCPKPSRQRDSVSVCGAYFDRNAPGLCPVARLTLRLRWLAES